MEYPRLLMRGMWASFFTGALRGIVGDLDIRDRDRLSAAELTSVARGGDAQKASRIDAL